MKKLSTRARMPIKRTICIIHLLFWTLLVCIAMLAIAGWMLLGTMKSLNQELHERIQAVEGRMRG